LKKHANQLSRRADAQRMDGPVELGHDKVGARIEPYSVFLPPAEEAAMRCSLGST
jgi:hypothetical protein